MGQREEDAQTLARLAALGLSEPEQQALSAHLDRVLEYVAKLDQVPTDGVEPLIQPNGVIAPFRDDRPTESLSVDRALLNAPETQDNQIKVPRVVERGK